MIIQRRNLPVFILLNCLTLGIYGAIQSNKMGNEINALCKNDGEQPGMGYFGALFIRAIPAFFGILVGLVAGIISTSLVSMSYSYLSFGVFGKRKVKDTVPLADSSSAVVCDPRHRSPLQYWMMD